MKLADIFESRTVDFDVNFIREVAKDRDVDLSKHSTEAIKKMHDEILAQALEMIDDKDMGLDPEDVGQEYYDKAKEYFN